MSTTIENIAPCRKRLRVEVNAERVATVRAEILQSISEAREDSGVPAGKAPESMVEKRYAHDIDEELQKRIIPDTYRETLKENKLRAVGYPQIETVDYKPGQPLVYTAGIDTAPEFSLPDYKGIPLKKKEAPVSDDAVTRMVDALREQNAEFVTVEGRPLRSGDFAVLNYSGVADGKPILELVPEARTLGENRNFWLLIESSSFLPGFCDQLIGAAAGEKRQVLVDFPADFPQKPLAARKATYFVDVVAIKEKKLPELNDDFAKKIGLETVDKIKEEVRKGLEAERENEGRAELRKQVIDYLLDRVEFELPESLVTQETRSIVYDVVRENTLRGISKESLEEKKNEIFGYATKSARDRLRSSFILDAIAEAEGMKVEESEVEERIAQLAQRHRVTPQKLKTQMVERNGLAEIEEQILAGKTLDFLVSNAKVETVSQA